MPATFLRIEMVADEDTFTPELMGIEGRLIDIEPCYDALWSAFRKIEQRRFTSEGPGWEPLAPSTVAGREAMGIGGSHPILNRTGVTYEGEVGGSLRKSFTTKGSKYSYMEPLPDGLFMGSKHPLAGIHQGGAHGAGRDHNVTIPARPLVDLNEADADVFASIISEWIYGFGVSDTAVFSAEDDTVELAVVGA